MESNVKPKKSTNSTKFRGYLTLSPLPPSPLVFVWSTTKVSKTGIRWRTFQVHLKSDLGEGSLNTPCTLKNPRCRKGKRRLESF